MRSLSEWVKAYATRGWRVIPDYEIVDGQCSCKRGAHCEHPGKHPRQLDWIARASSDLTILEEYWSRWPGANVSILTGPESGVVVLDIDPRHQGIESLANIEKEHGLLPDHAVVETGGGGYHYYFAYPEGSDIRTTLVAPGVELKGKGAKVTAPPSMHGSGRQYTWISDREVPPLPAWLLPIKKRGRPPTTPKATLTGVPKGQRDVELFRYACALRSKGTPREEAEVLVLTKAAACDPPVSEQEARAKVDSAWKYSPKDEGNRLAVILQQDPIPEENEYGDCTYSWTESMVTVTMAGLVETADGVDAELSVYIRPSEEAPLQIIHGPVRFHLLSQSAREIVGRYLRKRYPKVSDWEHYLEAASRLSVEKLRKGAPVIDLQEFRNGKAPTTWLYSPFVLNGLPTVLYADGGIGKSVLALAIHLSIQTGRQEILHLPPPEYPVIGLYLDWETNPTDHGHRLNRLLQGAGIEYGQRVPYLHCTGPISTQVVQIKQKAQKEGASFIIVDSVALATGGEPESAAVALQYFDTLNRIGLPSFSIAHRPRHSQNIFGSVFFRNSARSVWAVSGELLGNNESRLTFHHEKSNVGYPVRDFSYTLKFGSDSIFFTPTSGDIFSFSEPSPPLPPTLNERIRALLRNHPMTLEMIATALATDLDIIRRALQSDFDLTRQPGGTYAVA